MKSYCRVAVFVWMMCIVPASAALADIVVFDLDNVWLDPDISHPTDAAREMTGSFTWTYDKGDFENGAGQFDELQTPWYNPGIDQLNITVDTTSIEFSLKGNLDNLGLDLTMFLVEPFSADKPVAIDLVRSKFDIQNGVSYQGHFQSGSIVPRTVPEPSSLSLMLSLGIFGLAVFALRHRRTCCVR